MNEEVELLKFLIEESFERVFEKKETSEDQYKKLNKHCECTKCQTIIS